MNQYKILTVTHKQVPVEELRHYIVNDDKHSEGFSQKLTSVKNKLNLDELMYLNTCNRVTYFFTTKTEVGGSFATHFFKTINPEFEACNAVNSHVYEGPAALAHLCELGASLDSMVVGEREIIRQLRLAYEDSQKMNLTGDDIRLAMKFVIPAAKKIYTETKIAEKPVSIVSLAAQKLKELNVPQSAKFILIGAGETISAITTYLMDMGYKNFVVFNRTLSNAEKIASKINGKAFLLNELISYKEGFDVIITSTSSSKAEISQQIYAGILNGDKSKKIIIDLAIPADTEKYIIENYPVEYIQIDSLRGQAQKNLTSRKSEIYKAKQLVHEFVKKFQRVHMERMVEKAHSIIPVKLNEIRKKAVEEVYAKEISQLDDDSKQVIDKLLNYMEKKYIALTMASSKEAFRNKH